MLTLDSPLGELPGIGPRRSRTLAKAGLRTVEDLFFYLPLRYEDRRRCARAADMISGDRATLRARVLSPRLIRTRRRGFTIVEALLDDGTDTIRAVWYNQPYLMRVLVAGRAGFFFGVLRLPRAGERGLVMENPEVEMLEQSGRAEGVSPAAAGDDAPAEGIGASSPGTVPEATLHTGRIVPIYRAIGGLGARSIRRLMHQAFESVGDRMEDFLPAELRRKVSLTWRAAALRGVHFPPPGTSLEEIAEDASGFRRRLIFEEFFLLQLGLALRRHDAHQQDRGFRYRFTEETRGRLASLLPFALTRAQKKVLKEIREDMEGTAPMNRLLQGDVGSGKTVIAALTLAIVAENGLQAALMAPTEILAAQHHRHLQHLLGPAGYRIDLLTGSIKGAARREILHAVQSGESSILIGTHALMGSAVRFARLGAVVVDEQHRFGVLQRATLREKGYRPDTLVMTATPIPRSLALTVYGDLDHSLLDELPAGRKTIKTLLRTEENRESVYEGIRRELGRGRQAFIVYPLVEEDERAGLTAAVEMSQRLASGPFSNFKVACVHGRQPRETREETMLGFVRGDVQVLVATTVVEVGIDVPNATVLVVEHPERFGLSQLHQLRGRVGRGREKSYCILMAPEKVTEEARKRLEVLVNESNGFRIAERDMELRGPGDITGTRQHGLPSLRVGNLNRDAALMELARRLADVWVERFSTGQARMSDELAKRLEKRWAGNLDLALVG